VRENVRGSLPAAVRTRQRREKKIAVAADVLSAFGRMAPTVVPRAARAGVQEFANSSSCATAAFDFVS